MYGISIETWKGAIVGAVLGSIVIPIVLLVLKGIVTWWRDNRPQAKLLLGIVKQSEPCRIFVSDLQVPPGVTLVSVAPNHPPGSVPNIGQVWPDVEGRATASIFGMLGRVGKTENVAIVHRSQDFGEWNCNIIVVGGQSPKAYDFYNNMEQVAFRMNAKDIIDQKSGSSIPRANGYGYGIILKSRNPLKMSGSPGVAFLVGGFGTLGTGAAAYYLRENYKKLGREFRKDCFGIVVRASISAGEQSVERLTDLDYRFCL